MKIMKWFARIGILVYLVLSYDTTYNNFSRMKPLDNLLLGNIAVIIYFILLLIPLVALVYYGFKKI